MDRYPKLRFATFLAPNVFPVYRFIAEYVGEKLGCETEIVVGNTHDEFGELCPDIAFICGLPYVQMMRLKPPLVDVLAAPVLQGERYGGKPIYFSDVIVRHGSPLQSFADLRGHSWAYNEMVSQSGYGITRHHLLQMGAAGGFFSQVVDAGWHQKAIRMVAAGKVDGAAIDSQVLAVEMRDHPDLASQIKVIDTLGPSTIQPVVARADLPDAVKADVKAVLLAMGDDESAKLKLAAGFFERFVSMLDSDYNDIRGMLKAAESANFLTIR